MAPPPTLDDLSAGGRTIRGSGMRGLSEKGHGTCSVAPKSGLLSPWGMQSVTHLLNVDTGALLFMRRLRSLAESLAG